MFSHRLMAYGLHQMTPKPTHMIANLSSCNELIYTNQLNLAEDCGVHPSFKLHTASWILQLISHGPITEDSSGLQKGQSYVIKKLTRSTEDFYEQDSVYQYIDQ